MENQLPENELWQLYRTAYKQYQSEILNGEKAYSRYVNDFFTYHLPLVGMSEADMRLHVMHVCSVKELLDNRRDLVDAFFSKPSFEESDYQKMLRLFDTGESLQPATVGLAQLGEQQIQLITEFVNETSLFKGRVTANDIVNLFSCKLSTPLQANSNRHVAVFFSALRDIGLLPYPWQMIIEQNKLVSSSSNNLPLRASQIRCGLSQAKVVKLGKKHYSKEQDDKVGFYDTCDEFMKKLKKSL